MIEICFFSRSWTINEYSSDGEVQWHGLFYRCNRLKCSSYYNDNFSSIISAIVSAALLLVVTVFIFLMGVHSFPRRHFYLTPFLTYLAVLLLILALVFYAHGSIINGISVRLVIAAIVLTYIGLAMVSFVAGRYSIFYQTNPIDFQYTKTGNRETATSIEEQQTMQRAEH